MLAWWPIRTTASSAPPPAAFVIEGSASFSARSAIGRTSTPAGIRSRSMLVPTMCQSPTVIRSAPPSRSAVDDRQHLVGHQPPAPRVGGGVRGQAVAVIVDPRDPLHVRGDQDVHRRPPPAARARRRSPARSARRAPAADAQLGRRVRIHLEAGELHGARRGSLSRSSPRRRRPGRGSRPRRPRPAVVQRAVTSERLKSRGVRR